MKGKSIFTAKIAAEIKNKLDQCNEAGRYANMSLRYSLRYNYSFYIIDFETSKKRAFTAEHFDHHVSIGNIQITECTDIDLLANIENQAQHIKPAEV